VIICAGTEYQWLYPEAYRDDEISCVKIHMLITAPQPTQRIHGNILSGLSIRRYEAFRECPSYEEIVAKNDLDPRIAKWGVHILFKQADNGQVILGDAHHYADAHEKEELGFELDQEVNAFILEKAREIMELETYAISAQWMGIYSQAKQVDIIEKMPEDRVNILNAIGGKGMTAGPGYTYAYIQKLFGHD
jgi:glycine/D-amino acid oxidase-like deaminating enzyme